MPEESIPEETIPENNTVETVMSESVNLDQPLFRSFLRSVRMQLRATCCQLYRISESGIFMEAQVGRPILPSAVEQDLSKKAVETGLLQVAQGRVQARTVRGLTIALPVMLQGVVVGVLVAHSIPAESLQAIRDMIPHLSL